MLKRFISFMVFLSLSMAGIAHGAEGRVGLEISEFSISPLYVELGDSILLKWRVANTGTAPLTVQPLVQFVLNEQALTVEADDPPKSLAAGQSAKFSATTQPVFKQDGDYSIWVTAREVEGKGSGWGFVYPEKLNVHVRRATTAPADKGREAILPSRPLIDAHTDRPFYFQGETVSISGVVTSAKKDLRTLKISGSANADCQVDANGHFKCQIPAQTSGVQELVLTAENLPAATVEFYVAGDELGFPRLFGTNETYQAGIFSGVNGEAMRMLPEWADLLGVKFVANQPLNGLEYGKDLEQMMTRAERLGVTMALVGSEDCIGGDPKTVKDDGMSDERYANFLSAKFQQDMLDRFTNLALSMRQYRSFRYLLLMPEWFRFDASFGYDPENLERFGAMIRTSRPDLALPAVNDPKAWYQLFRKDQSLYKTTWRLWREGTWTDYMVRLQDALRVSKPDLVVGTCESNFMGIWFWNRGMLASRGITAHAPHTNFPNADTYSYVSMARDDRRTFGYESLFLSLSIWEDVTFEPEQLTSGMFGIIKAGGTRTPAWSDYGLRANWKYLNPQFGNGAVKSFEQYATWQLSDGALQSPITDLLTGVSDHRKSRAMQDAAAQLRRLPYKDRFRLYEQYGGTLPFSFTVRWDEAGREMEQKCRKEGTSAGGINDSVYAVVQDWQSNGYAELLLFNDVQQGDQEKNQPSIFRTDDGYTRHVYTFDQNSLRERRLTLIADAAKDVVPFVDGEPWLYYHHKGVKLAAQAIPFEKQQVRLVQLVNIGREPPHVTESTVGISRTMLNLQQKKLWLKLADLTGGELAVDCGNWGKPSTIERGNVSGFDTNRVKITIDSGSTYVVAKWQ